MRGDNLVLFQEMISAPHGIILIAGPTGSGESTTIYDVLEEVARRAEEDQRE